MKWYFTAVSLAEMAVVCCLAWSEENNGHKVEAQCTGRAFWTLKEIKGIGILETKISSDKTHIVRILPH